MARNGRALDRKRAWALGSSLTLAAFTLLALPGYLSHFRRALTPYLGDALLNVVFLEWGARQLALGLPDYWNAPFFYPARMVMALSDHLIGLAALRLALARLGAGPVTSYNLLLFASFVATGWATLWLARRAGLSRPAALLASVLFTFSQFRLMHVIHLQILWAPFLPLTLGTFDRLFERPTPSRAAAFVTCYALHLTGGTYLAYMIHFPLAAIAVLRAGPALSAGRRGARAALLAGTAALALGAAWLAFEPYRKAAEIHPMKRNVGYLRDLGATAASFATPDSRSRAANLLFDPSRRTENSLFPGFVATPLLAAAAVRALAAFTRSATRRRRRLAIAGAVLVAAALAIGDYRSWTGADRLDLGQLSVSIRGYRAPFRTLVLGLALVAFTVWSGRARRKRAPSAALRRSLALASLVALLFCFPTVYVPIARWVPGLDAMRAPARFFAFASLGLAIAAAAEADRWRRGITPRKRALALPFLLAIVAWEVSPRESSWSDLESPNQFQEVDRRIAELPEVRVLAELPLPDLSHCEVDTLRVYYSSAHWKPIVNGCSGHFPDSYEELRAALFWPPFPEDLERLRALGVTHILLRDLPAVNGARNERQKKRWVAENSAAGRGEAIYDDGRAILFALSPRPGSR